MRSGLFHRAIQLRGQRAIQNVVYQRRFPRAGNAGDHRQQPERNRHVDILQIVAVRAENRDAPCRSGCGARPARESSACPERYCPVSDAGFAAISSGAPERHQVSARFSRARAQVHHVIRAANRLLVVLDHQHRVAQIAQRFERAEQPAVVARMQPDRRLVEHVEHAAQPRADLRRQANPLRFAAGKRGRRAVERQIAQPDVQQKIDALGNFRKRPRRRFSAAAA